MKSKTNLIKLLIAYCLLIIQAKVAYADLVVGYAGSGVQNKYNIMDVITSEIKATIENCSDYAEVQIYAQSLGLLKTDGPISQQELVNYALCASDIYSYATGTAAKNAISVAGKLAAGAIGFENARKEYNIYSENILTNVNDQPEIAINSHTNRSYSFNSNRAPSYVVFKNTKYLIFSDTEKRVQVARKDVNENINLGWLPEYPLNGYKTSDKPSSAVFNGRLYVMFRGDSSKHIYITSTSDGVNWSSAQKLPHQSSYSPTLTVVKVGGLLRLTAAFRGASSKRLYVMGSYNGRDWDSPIRLNDQSSNAPYITEHKGNLYMAFKGASSDHLYIAYSTNGGYNWSSYRVSSDTTNRGPALASHGGKLYLAYKGRSTNYIYWRESINGLNSSSWSTPKTFGKNKTSGSLTLFSN